MGAAFSTTALKQGSKTVVRGAAGGAVAKILADNLSAQLAPVLGGLAPYSRPITAILGAYLTDRVMKNRDLALGMAGAAGAELAPRPRRHRGARRRRSECCPRRAR